MKNFWCLLFGLALSSPSFSQNDAFDLKGLPLGASVADLKAKFPEYYCSSNAGNTISDTSCSLSPETKCLLEQSPYPDNKTCRDAVMNAMTYAGVQSNISLFFYNDKLGMVQITFGAKSFTEVTASMREKYGEPTSQKAEQLINRMGVAFENQTLEWKATGTTIQAEKFAGRIDKSSVKIIQDAYFIEFKKRRGAKTQQGAKDI